MFLEADHDGPAVLARVGERADLPTPSYLLTSSPRRLHIFWRVTGFDTPFPYSLGHEYMPNADRVLGAIRQTLEW